MIERISGRKANRNNDMRGCGCDSESDNEEEEELTKEQMRSVVKALKGEVEEDVVEKKLKQKKEELENVLGGRKPKGGRYGRRFTERLLPPP